VKFLLKIIPLWKMCVCVGGSVCLCIPS